MDDRHVETTIFYVIHLNPMSRPHQGSITASNASWALDWLRAFRRLGYEVRVERVRQTRHIETVHEANLMTQVDLCKPS
jgi:hypothetical protein